MVRTAPLTDVDAATVATWVTSRRALTLFAGPTLPYPFSSRDLLATATPTWHVIGFHDRESLVATGSYGFRAPGLARIGRVIVDPQRRGEGYGRVVMIALIACALALPEVRVVTLGVYEHNHSARSLYGTLGFSETGQRTEIDVDGEMWTSIEMELPVG